MSARSKARKRALDVLFAADLRGESALEALDAAIADGEGPTNDYTETLVRGVVAEQERIDALLAEHAQGWSLDRMPAVDRNVLRLGVYEMLCVDDVPDAVAVSEAVALVQDLSTDESPSFVNGVLGAVLRQTRLSRSSAADRPRVDLVEDLDLVADPDRHAGGVADQVGAEPHRAVPAPEAGQRRGRLLEPLGGHARRWSGSCSARSP